MEPSSQKKILMIVGDFVDDYEVMVPFQILQMAGHEVHAASPDKKKGDKIKTAIHDFEGDQTFTEKRGHNFVLTADFDSVKPEDYDGLYLPGGRAPEFLRLNKKVIEITKHFLEKDKPLAAICHGIQILTATGSLKGRYLTCFEPVSVEVKLAGGNFNKMEDENAATDGNLVTGVSWPGHPAVLKLFLGKLGTGFTKS